MPRALLSVSDKRNIVELATTLTELGWDLVASGGTGDQIRAAGLTVTTVESLTQLPEMLGGRVKTLHPAIHAGILARDNETDLNDLREHNYAPINMIVCNLYPFQETVSQTGSTLQDAIEQLDIGGVTLLRAAAKNFIRVSVVCDPNDYDKITEALNTDEGITLAMRRELAVKAFAYTRDYDTAIHAFLSQDMALDLLADTLPEHLSLGMRQVDELRYGENPHQVAGYYSRQTSNDPLGSKQLSGKQLSYNNILDVDAAWRAVSSFDEPTVVIVKHLTPTGIASAETINDAYPRALDSDPVSAFGGIIAVNRPVEEEFVRVLGALFVEAIAAPSFSSEAERILSEKRKNCRLLRIAQQYDGTELEIRSVFRGLLVQRADLGDPEGTLYKTVSKRPPTQQEFDALMFAWKTVQHVKSNAIVLAQPGATVGIGGGLPSRVDAVNLAVSKAGDRAQGAVMASDAFFPFADGVAAAAHAGVTAVIQPGGSIRDNEVIQAVDDANMAMIFTGTRHFRH